MDWVFPILLFLHVMGAIIAFGPPYSFMILGPMSGREPSHSNFALRFQEATSKRLILPLAVFQGVTGVLLIWKVGINLFATGWLLVAIVLYLIALGLAFLVLIPTVNKLVEATSTPPPPPPPPAPGATPPAGPPPHIAALIKRARMASTLNALLIVIIVFLMVTKPF